METRLRVSAGKPDNILAGEPFGRTVMVRAGDTIHSRATGEHFTFIHTATDTGGKLLRIDMRVDPGGGAHAVPMHVHPKQEERFTVLEGLVQFRLGDRLLICEPGDTVVVPAGTPHTWKNAGVAEARFLVEIEPAGAWELLFEGLCRLSEAGQLSPTGRVHPLHMAVSLHRYPDQLYLAGLPIPLQKRLFAVLAFIGERLGYGDVERQVLSERIAEAA
jgi:mannose-6-phosphate isomerase-like protein (cupin superfamily)